MRRDHFFDWHGFKYVAKILVLCIIAGTVGRYGLLYASQSSSTAPSLVLIQETRPAPGKSLSLTLSTTTSQHIINTLTISDAVPPTGKFIAADLSNTVLTLYQDSVAIPKYTILAKGKSGSPYAAPAGFYTVLAKESDHFNNVEQVDLPWSVRLYANYFIHGLPYYDDGSPVNSSYTGEGIRLSTDDAAKVYEFVDTGTNVFVYDPVTVHQPSLVLDTIPVPSVSAVAYLVADVDTGDVFLEQNAGDSASIASTTKLMTALVANEMVPRDKKSTIAGLARIYNTAGFINWMNMKARALDMRSTYFSDAIGTSTENVSTADDLFRLTTYLAHEKSFILDASATQDTSVSVYAVPINGVERRVAIIVLKSDDFENDTTALFGWFTRSAELGADMAGTACITCAVPPPYRKIQL